MILIYENYGLHSKVLKESTFLPERLREVLSLDGLNLELQINADQMIALNYIYSGLNESRTYFMSRKCMIAFFGDPWLPSIPSSSLLVREDVSWG